MYYTLDKDCKYSSMKTPYGVFTKESFIYSEDEILYKELVYFESEEEAVDYINKGEVHEESLEEESYECDECGKEYVSEYHYKKHIEDCDGE